MGDITKTCSTCCTKADVDFVDAPDDPVISQKNTRPQQAGVRQSRELSGKF